MEHHFGDKVTEYDWQRDEIVAKLQSRVQKLEKLLMDTCKSDFIRRPLTKELDDWIEQRNNVLNGG